MVNALGNNGRENGKSKQVKRISVLFSLTSQLGPDDDILRPVLHLLAQKAYTLPERLEVLADEHGYRIGCVHCFCWTSTILTCF